MNEDLVSIRLKAVNEVDDLSSVMDNRTVVIYFVSGIGINRIGILINVQNF